jgi:4-diphosphocytidyl-2C-methyl-D-erythritol kinase
MPPVPRLERKTERLYASLKASHYTGGQITDRLIAWLTKGSEVTPANLFNVFDDVAFDNFTGLRKYWQQFLKAGAREAHLAGSGPALFTLTKDKAQAEKIYEKLQKQGMESYLTDTLATIEQVE